MSVRIVSGMRPTGNLHLGNYFGAIKQFLDLQAGENECFFFVADIHALTEIKESVDIDSSTYEVTKNYLACGVDPIHCTLYRQSDVPEVSEIALLLGNIVSLGRLQTCTTFKDRLRNRRMTVEQVSYGLLGYPVLMAADILCVKADRVPVGHDQVQHVEMTRDFARTFNRMFNTDVFVVPAVNVQSPIRVPGVDGAEKMGKSDGNTIALLDDLAAIKKKIRSIPTQTGGGGDMSPGTKALYTLMELCSPSSVYQDYFNRYSKGEDKFFGVMKDRLIADIVSLLEPIQKCYRALNKDDVRDVLREGAMKVRSIAADVLEDMRAAIGIHKRKE